jgi:hypothetical protein
MNNQYFTNISINGLASIFVLANIPGFWSNSEEAEE